MALSIVFLIVAMTIIAQVVYRLSRIGRRPPEYPPGPPTLPVLGNLHQMPSKDGHLKLREWAKEYGSTFR